MKKMKMMFIAVLMGFALIGLSSCDLLENNTEDTTESLSASEVLEYTTQDIFTSDKEASNKDLVNTYDDDYTTLDLSSGDVEITVDGSYMLSGTYTNTTITVNVTSEEKVTLLLDNLTVTNTDSAVIYVVNADKVSINVIDDSESTLTVTDTFADTEEGIDSVIYSKDDLTVKGTGTLNIVTSDTGIKSKDDLVLSSLTISVTALNNGIVGKDSLVISSGDYTVNADKDAIKSNGDEEDGVLIITDGDFDLTSGDDSISATNLVIIEDGSFIIDSSDDGIKSDGDIVINGGSYVIEATDDGISTEYDLQVNGGDISILSCYEGLEGKNVRINDGSINIKSSDDGINASDPDDADVTESNDPDGNYHSTSEEVIISQFGGDIFIDTSADGVDSNGNIYIDGGTLTISGYESDMENPMDYNLNAIIVSGDIISIGYSGMAQNFTVSSSNISVMYNFTQESAGNLVEIKDSNGDTVFTYTLLKSASSVLISNDILKSNSTYTISVGDSSEEFSTSDSNIITIGTASSNSGPGRR